MEKVGFSKINQLRISYCLHVIMNVFVRRQRKFGNLSLCTNDEYYGHEYWLKHYSGFKKNIFAVIEHGLYFGENKNRVGNPLEYEMPAIITYGDYRKEVLNVAFPDKEIVNIGPRIAYVQRDESYYNEINGLLKGNKKLLTIFPAHSLSTIKMVYDVDTLMDAAQRLAKKHLIDNIFVCLPYGDTINGNSEVFSSLGLKVLTAGQDAISFLPRLRSIIEASTISLSNSLGTNLGYCVFLGCQQILIPQQIIQEGKDNAIDKENHGNDVRRQYLLETTEFAKIFNENTSLNVSKEQYGFCDYYFGYKYVRKPEELKEILNKIFQLRH